MAEKLNIPWRTAQVSSITCSRETSDSGEPASTISARCTPSRDPYEADIALCYFSGTGAGVGGGGATSTL